MATDNGKISAVTINENIRGSSNGDSGKKAFAGVILLLLVIAGVYAMMKPMYQNLDYMKSDITIMQKKMEEDDERERNDRGIMTAMAEKFIEVETQFRNLKEIMELKDAYQVERINVLELELSKALLDIAKLQENLRMKENLNIKVNN